MNDQSKKLFSFYRAHKRMPSYSEMAKLFGYKSKNAVYRLVQKLIDAGIVGKDHLGKLVPTSLFSELPLAGSVKAGLPSSVEEVRDRVSLEDMLVGKREDTYLLEVDGDSMIDAHIADGDLVLVERTNVAKDGDIVIAEIDGEHTMKYLRRKGSAAWLEPANKRFNAMHPSESLTVTGIVRAVIRKLV